jgi:hypothetical protein
VVVKRVVLHIDRLSLHGLRRAQGAGFAEALRAELARALSGPGVLNELASRGDRASRDVPRVRIRAAENAAPLGARVARGIAQSLRT